MDSRAPHEPPFKRRRYSSEDERDPTDFAISSPSNTVLEPPRKRYFQTFASELEEEQTEVKSEASPTQQKTTPHARPPLIEHPIDNVSNRGNDTSIVKFDREMFSSFVGDDVSEDTLAIIRERCGDNLERAVNMYFDGTWKKLKTTLPSLGGRPPASSSLVQEAPHQPQVQQTSRSKTKLSVKSPPYIGAFGVEGWATRSGVNRLKHGDIIKLERQKILPPAPPKPKAKLGQVVSTTPQRVSMAVSKRVDVLVRFTDQNGMEIGRLDKDTATWVSTLIDQKVCKFEGTCVYAPERLRTNDTIFIQLRVYLLPSAFFSSAFTGGERDNRAAGLYEEKESAEEKDLRLRQVALVRLFLEISLLPTRANATAANAKSQRQGLLAAAEIAEAKASEPPKVTNSATK